MQGKYSWYRGDRSFLFLLILFSIILSISSNSDAYPSQEEQEKILSERGFFLWPTNAASLFDLYGVEQDTLLTADLLLHAWHRVFDASTRIAEIRMVLPELKRLSLRMFDLSMQQAKDLAGTPHAESAKANAAYFAVALCLLDDAWSPSRDMEGWVRDEVEKIKKAGGVDESPVMSLAADAPVRLDYGLFLPRGHYTRTPEFARLFQVYSWYGKANFYIDGKGDGPIGRAFLLTQALYSDPEALALWSRLNAFIGFLAGPLDDASPAVFQEILARTAGTKAPGNLIDDASFSTLLEEARYLPYPLIDSEVEMGKHRVFTFLGQRLSLDERIIDEVVDPKTPNRWLPSGLDVAFALGSEKAGELPMDPILANQIGDPTPGRLKALTMVEKWPEERWRESLGAYWLAAIRGLYRRPEGKVQKFIEHPDWEVKLVQTGLGAWTEMRHDLVAFVKPHYLTLGKTIGEQKPKWWSYVEPYPETYRQISLACEQYGKILGRFDVKEKEALRRLESLGHDAARFEALAQKELAGTPLEISEYDWIRRWPFENRWIEQPPKGFKELYTKTDLRMALVVDIAHALEPYQGIRATLQEAVGDPSIIVARAMFGDETVILRGGTYSHFEFINTSDDLLTDEKWQAMAQITPHPPYLEVLYGKTSGASLGQWQPLTVDEPFGGFYQYGDVLLGPEDSLIVPVHARKPGAPDVRAFWGQLWLEIWGNEDGLVTDLVKKIPEAGIYTAYAFFRTDRGQYLTIRWLRGFYRMVPWLMSKGILSPKWRQLPKPETIFDEMNRYGFYKLVPEHSGIFIWRKGSKKPEKLLDVPAGMFALSPDGTKLALTTGPPVPDISAQGDMPAVARVMVIDVNSGERQLDKSIDRAPTRPSLYGMNYNLAWQDDSTLHISRGEDIKTDRAYDVRIDLLSGEIEYLNEETDNPRRNRSNWDEAISQKLNRGIKHEGIPGQRDGNEWILTDGQGQKLKSLGVLDGLQISRPRERNWKNKAENVSPDQTAVIVQNKIGKDKYRHYLVRLNDLSALPLLDSRQHKHWYNFITWSEDHHALFNEFTVEKGQQERTSQLIHINGDTGQARRIGPWPHRPLRLFRPLDAVSNRWVAMAGGGAGGGSGHFLIQQEPFFQPAKLSGFPLLEKPLSGKGPSNPFEGAKPVPPPSEKKSEKVKTELFALPDADSFPSVEGEWPVGRAKFLGELLPHRAAISRSYITDDGRYLYFIFHKYKDGLFPLRRAFGDMLFQYRRNIGHGWLVTYLWDYLREATRHASVFASKKHLHENLRYLHRVYPEESGLIRCKLPAVDCQTVKGLYGNIEEDPKGDGLLAVKMRPLVLMGNVSSTKEDLLPDELVHLDEQLNPVGKPVTLELADRYGDNAYPFQGGLFMAGNVVYDDPGKKQVRARSKEDYESVFGEDLCAAFDLPKVRKKPFTIDITGRLEIKSLPTFLWNDNIVCLENGQSYRLIHHYRDRNDKFLEVRRPGAEPLRLQWMTSYGKSGVPMNRVLSPDGERLMVIEESGDYRDRKNVKIDVTLVDLKTGEQQTVFHTLQYKPEYLFWLSTKDIVLYRLYMPEDDTGRVRTIAIDLANRRHYLVPYLDSFPENLFWHHTADGRWALIATENRKMTMLRLPKPLEQMIQEKLEGNETNAFLPDAWKKK